MDILLLTELTFCIYLGQQNPDDVTGFFLRSFIPLALITVVVSRILIKKMHTSDVLDAESLAANS